MREINITALAKGTKGVYIIEIDGEETQREVIRVFEDPSNLLKKRTLEVLIKGLINVQSIVEHGDELYICLENSHLINWLLHETEYKGYDALSTILRSIDDIDCKVRYKQKNMRNEKRRLDREDTKKEESVGFARILMED